MECIITDRVCDVYYYGPGVWRVLILTGCVACIITDRVSDVYYYGPGVWRVLLRTE